jgi:hypothetical protein
MFHTLVMRQYFGDVLLMGGNFPEKGVVGGDVKNEITRTSETNRLVTVRLPVSVLLACGQGKYETLERA